MMKCPYRKFRIDDEEHFMDCYGTECPYYVPEQEISKNAILPPYCGRVENERWAIINHKEK